MSRTDGPPSILHLASDPNARAVVHCLGCLRSVNVEPLALLSDGWGAVPAIAVPFRCRGCGGMRVTWTISARWAGPRDAAPAAAEALRVAAPAAHPGGMCGRYASHTPLREIARLFHILGPLPNFPPTWNLAPTQPAPVIRLHPDSGERRLDLLTWGFLPSWTKDATAVRRPINARAETVGTSAMFRGAFAKRRALVPADAFYEWQATGDGKRPYAVARTDGGMLAFAGLWEGWRGPDGEAVRSFAIVTTDANADMRPIHDRMPVILEPADWPVWLGEAAGDPAALLRPSPDGTLRAWPISARVNAPRHNGPDLLAAVGG
jgi:putative SOS response-associated peptidase YedK